MVTRQYCEEWIRALNIAVIFGFGRHQYGRCWSHRAIFELCKVPVMAYPLTSPSVPGHGRMPAPLFHWAAQAFAAKSYPETVGDEPDTFTSTQMGFEASVPMPNNFPLALLRIQ